jgi:hypothetical protein
MKRNVMQGSVVDDTPTFRLRKAAIAIGLAGWLSILVNSKVATLSEIEGDLLRPDTHERHWTYKTMTGPAKRYMRMNDYLFYGSQRTLAWA